ncbi:HSP20-like chaperone [Coniophora puteana RWD-64-598 SS2]|uniref:HSP20-like chaperone n=1 Tax=Coniophora puteana (strain RWD-64-598) TaxID=741705 RepID=A0A5M3MPI5_CONPW|nr:HSP20-like chaperone [Coniophora puteana RWD-64-598 SS2]EIW80966.1 HSP20-like chaperone [Coniophora puteana RWD-64-598 SS2]
MSIARQLFREFRPFFQMLEQPLGRAPASLNSHRYSLFDDPFIGSFQTSRPALDVTEEGSNYIVEAELPGVKKEDLNVRIGGDGRSVTIEGKVFSRRSGGDFDPNGNDNISQTNTSDSSASLEADVNAGAVQKSDPSTTELASERASSISSSTFSRTVWLPQMVDSSKVSAKLDHGVLTLTIPKVEDKAHTTIKIE